MRAYIHSSVDNHMILQGLKEQAGNMAGYSIGSKGAPVPNSTEMPSLRVLKSVDGHPTSVIISRHDTRTLVASLENAERLINGTAKSRLAALLIPLVTEYVGTRSLDLAAGDTVRIAFGEPIRNGRPGRKCILFAEDSSNHFVRNRKAHSSPLPEHAHLSHSELKVTAGAKLS